MTQNTINILKHLCEENIGISNNDLITALIGYASELCTVPNSRVATLNKHMKLISMIEMIVRNIDTVMDADKKNAKDLGYASELWTIPPLNNAERETITRALGVPIEKSNRIARLELRVHDLEGRVATIEDDMCSNFDSCVAEAPRADLTNHSRLGNLELLVTDIEGRVSKLEDDACSNYGSCVVKNNSVPPVDHHE